MKMYGPVLRALYLAVYRSANGAVDDAVRRAVGGIVDETVWLAGNISVGKATDRALRRPHLHLDEFLRELRGEER